MTNLDIQLEERNYPGSEAHRIWEARQRGDYETADRIREGLEKHKRPDHLSEEYWRGCRSRGHIVNITEKGVYVTMRQMWARPYFGYTHSWYGDLEEAKHFENLAFKRDQKWELEHIRFLENRGK